MSWNCQGLGDYQDLTISRLEEMRKKYFPEVLFLMETKNCRNMLLDLQVWLGYDRVFTVEPVGRSGGLALFWKNKVNIDFKYVDKHLLDYLVQFEFSSFHVSCIYGDPVMKSMPLFLERITRIRIQRKGSWCMLGNFNDLLHNGEKVGDPSRSEDTFVSFVNMIKACNMKELPSHGNAFTWGGMKYKLWIQCKLDRCFGNSEWFYMFPVATQAFLEKIGSYHNPVLVKLLSSQETYKGYFRFDRRMLHKPLVKENILASWNYTGPDNNAVFDRIRLCRRALSGWKKANPYTHLKKSNKFR